MAKLGSFDLTAETLTEIYECPASNEAAVKVIFVARDAAQTVRLAHVEDGTAAAAKDYIEYDAVIPSAGGVLVTDGLSLTAGEKLWAYASAANCSVGVIGIEEEIV